VELGPSIVPPGQFAGEIHLGTISRFSLQLLAHAATASNTARFGSMSADWWRLDLAEPAEDTWLINEVTLSALGAALRANATMYIGMRVKIERETLAPMILRWSTNLTGRKREDLAAILESQAGAPTWATRAIELPNMNFPSYYQCAPCRTRTYIAARGRLQPLTSVRLFASRAGCRRSPAARKPARQ
jgi:hypothetical protein